ncbi:MAG: CdaR family protein [Victivallaceae bacterium]|nr:CdaR family protein [Victivallaceae bacterium]
MEKSHSPVVNFLADFFTRDLLRKAVSLIMAIAIYVLISGNIGNGKMLTGVPLEVELPENLVNMDRTPPTLDRVIVRGNKAILNRLSGSDLRAKLKVRYEDCKSGQPILLRITPQDVKSPFATTVIGVEPQFITLNLEPKETLMLPIEPVFSGADEMDKDFSVEKTVFTPAAVTVTGTASLLRELKAIPTKPITLKNASGSFDLERLVLAPRPGIAVSPAVVGCHVSIVKENETKILPAVPVLLMMAPGSEEKFSAELVSHSNVRVNLYGPRGRLNLFNADTLKAYVDLTKITEPGVYTVDVCCQEPSDRDLQIRKIEPEQIEIKLTLKQKNIK